MITDSKFLKGREVMMTLSEFRKHPGDTITRVQMGETVTLTKNGKAVAVIHAPETTALELGAAARK